MEAMILALLQDLLYVAITALAGFAIAYLKKRLGVEKMRKIQEQSALIKMIVDAGVKYVEQRYQSGEKLDKAIEWISARLNEKGIKISEAEVEGLIEAAVRELKDQFGEEWGKATK